MTTETQQAEGAGRDARTERRARKLSRRVAAFAREHGGADGQIAYLGQRGFRLVLVGTDGAWGDLVAPSREAARQAAERAGVALHDTLDGDLAARIRTGPYEWSRMAGIQVGTPGGTREAREGERSA